MTERLATDRHPFVVTYSVWKALFFREALTRFFSARGAWFWLLVEPIFHIAYLVVIFTVIRLKHVGGMSTLSWLLLGLLGYFVFQRTGSQVMSAVDANKALFAYRQVKPVDTALVRAGLEGMILGVVATLLALGAGLLGELRVPDHPLQLGIAYAGLWLIGTGYGLVTSVVTEVFPDIGKFIRLLMMPLYILSGVIFPIAILDEPYRSWLLLNPIAHGLEAARAGYAEYYAAVPELSVAYMYGWALLLVFFGLALHRNFAQTLASQ